MADSLTFPRALILSLLSLGVVAVEVKGVVRVVLLSTRTNSSSSSSAMRGGVLINDSISRLRDEEGRDLRRRLPFASWSFHATAFNSRIRLASVTRRLNRGSVARVRKVSLRILVYAGERPRWIRERYSSVGTGGISRRMSHRYTRYVDYTSVSLSPHFISSPNQCREHTMPSASASTLVDKTKYLNSCSPSARFPSCGPSLR